MQKVLLTPISDNGETAKCKAQESIRLQMAKYTKDTFTNSSRMASENRYFQMETVTKGSIEMEFLLELELTDGVRVLLIQENGRTG